MKKLLLGAAFMLTSTFAFANNCKVNIDPTLEVDTVLKLDLNEYSKSIVNISYKSNELKAQTKLVNQEKQVDANIDCELTAYYEFADGTVIEIVFAVVRGMSCAQFNSILSSMMAALR